MIEITPSGPSADVFVPVCKVCEIESSEIDWI